MRIAPDAHESSRDPGARLAALPLAAYIPGDGSSSVLRDLIGAGGDLLVVGRGRAAQLAHDGDLIYHELTHAVIRHGARIGGLRLDEYGFSREPDAIGEALADYFAAALSGDGTIGEYAAREAPAALRSLEVLQSCRDSLTGAPHADSLTISGALWGVRQRLEERDRRALDVVVFGLASTPVSARDWSFSAFTRELLQRLEIELPSAAPALDEELERREIPDGCKPIVPLELGTTSRVGPSGFHAPSGAGGDLELVPGIVQFRADVPESGGLLSLRLRRATVREWPSDPANAEAFEPVLLARWDDPIHWWRAGGALLSDADVEAESQTTSGVQFDLELPRGVRRVYLQVANRGGAAGSYDELRATLLTGSRTTVPPLPVYESASCGLIGGRGARWSGGVFDAVPFIAVLLACNRRRRTAGGRRSHARMP